jgi:hypothetical protein
MSDKRSIIMELNWMLSISRKARVAKKAPVAGGHEQKTFVATGYDKKK